jgi:hypothetical protein
MKALRVIDHDKPPLLKDLSPTPAQLIVDMRTWAKAARARTCPLRLISPRFVLAGRVGELLPFHRFMLALQVSAARYISINTNENGDLTDDEVLILDVLTCLHLRQVGSARHAFATMICANCLDAVLHAALEMQTADCVAAHPMKRFA